MKRLFSIVLCTLLTWLCAEAAGSVNVTLTLDEGQPKTQKVLNAERNLAALLSEINAAQAEKRALNTKVGSMTQFAIESITMLWEIGQFYVDDSEVVERCWVFKNSMMVSGIPLIISIGNGEFGDGDYQEAVVEFDNQGNISDFRFALDDQTSESMSRCGEVATKEQQMIILQYVERFRTAYCTKDIKYLEQVFSEDALIITGHVTYTAPSDYSGLSTAKIEYSKQNKQQYLTNLRRAFARNKWIDVKFSPIGENGESGGCPGITKSTKDETRFGVRLRQEWRSSNYSDTGYIFLLWEIPEDGSSPTVHVRTWQPEWTDKAKTQKIDDSELFTLSDFGL